MELQNAIDHGVAHGHERRALAACHAVCNLLEQQLEASNETSAGLIGDEAGPVAHEKPQSGLNFVGLDLPNKFELVHL